MDPQPIRVLVVDDSAVVRKVHSDVLGAAEGIEVVATASNGQIALAKLKLFEVDLVVLDVEMPVMNGLETLVEIKRLYPRLAVVMCSTLTRRGASVAIDALARGAADYVTKPEGWGDRAGAIEALRSDLVPKVVALGRRARSAPAAPAQVAAAAPAAPRRRREPAPPVEVVVIAVSTGGPKALQEVIPRLPSGFPVPVLVVQHMPPVFTQLLSERLDRDSALHVAEAGDGEEVVPGKVLFAPGGRHLLVAREGPGVRCRLDDGPPENSCRPAADPLLRSAAEAYGGGVLTVVLTGMGHDGLAGAHATYAAGGEVLAQDEATSVVWGMPAAVVRAGLASEQVPLELVAARIGERVARGRVPVRSGAR
jgi:two-component system chemotaxis response regulator CheB